MVPILFYKLTDKLLLQEMDFYETDAHEQHRNKDSLLRWRDKSFPYYADLYALSDGELQFLDLTICTAILMFAHSLLLTNIIYIIFVGRYAEGRSCHGMDHYANKAKQSSEVPAPHSSLLDVPEGTSFHFDVEGPGDATNWFGADEFSPFPNQVNVNESPEAAYAPESSNKETFVPEQFQEKQRRTSCPSSSTLEIVNAKPVKRQKTRSTISTSDFQKRYLMLKKEEIDRFAAIEEKKMEDPYNIKKCVVALEGLTDLQMEEMIKAADIFKDNSANRETFLSFSRDETRLGWLRKQI